MHILLAASLAFAALATATVNTFDGKSGQRLNLVDTSIGIENNIYYKGIGRAQIYDNIGPLQAVNANSKPNAAVYGNLDRMDDDYPYITSKYTGQNKNFDLNSFYGGCILGNVAANCIIALAGYKNGARVATIKLTFTPSNRQSANLQKFVLDSTFKGIDSVRFYTSYTDRLSNPGLGGATFIDDINYTLN